MGYTTRFKITTVPTGDVTDLFQAMSDYDQDYGDYGSLIGGEIQFTGKFYYAEDDIRVISESLPDTVIIIDGVGEAYPDIWRMYIKDGRSWKQKAEIKFEPYDWARLE